MRIRKNVAHLSASEKAAFVKAVVGLKGRPSVLHPGEPGFSRFDDYPEIHMNAMMANPGWAHRGPGFFPWHRELLLQFENELVSVDSSVTIPYWDWTDPNSFPFTTDFLGTNGSGANGKVTDGPFASSSGWVIKIKDQATDPDYLQRAFGADPSATALPSAMQVSSTIGITPYDNAPWQGNSGGFRSSIESNLHNLVHRWVGGTMGRMTSPNDPVFFLHHANIDRLWSVWQRSHVGSAPYLPIAGAPTGQNLHDVMIFNDEPPPPWPMGASPASVLDTHSMGYRYDDEVELPHVPLNMSLVRVLFGVINDAPGVVIGPDGKPHPVPGGPGPVWNQLTGQQRDLLLGSALNQIARLVPADAIRKQLQDTASRLEGR